MLAPCSRASPSQPTTSLSAHQTAARSCQSHMTASIHWTARCNVCPFPCALWHFRACQPQCCKLASAIQRWPLQAAAIIYVSVPLAEWRSRCATGAARTGRRQSRANRRAPGHAHFLPFLLQITKAKADCPKVGGGYSTWAWNRTVTIEYDLPGDVTIEYLHYCRMCQPRLDQCVLKW